MKDLLILLCILLLLITLVILPFDVSNIFASVFSVVITVIILMIFKLAHGNMLSLGFAFMAYNLMMHFGFGIINFLVSEELARDAYTSWTLTFLNSSHYALAIMISAVAFESFMLAWVIGLKKKHPDVLRTGAIDIETETREKTACFIFGLVMLFGVLLYFMYLLFIGRMSLNMSYTDYRERVMADNDLYSWMMVFYPTGLLYVVASSGGKRRAIGVAAFIPTAIILLMTGNKGEVFYAVLAAFGVLGYQRIKLSKKLVALLCVILFVIIPVVTATRSTSVSEGFSLEFASITDPLLEIGMQIRCLVYSIDFVADGSYEFMYGYSYLKPICNILSNVIFPLRYLPDIPIDLTSSRSTFYGFGFTQVAEGYLNFGIFGAMLFFGITGYMIGRLEFKYMSPTKLCFVGSILTILINASRNVFYFVPGQVMMMLLIYIAVKMMSKTTIRSH